MAGVWKLRGSRKKMEKVISLPCLGKEVKNIWLKFSEIGKWRKELLGTE
jgi:hypothetical protein